MTVSRFRHGLAASFALASLALAVACGDDDATIVYVAPDGGPLATNDDGGGAACEPVATTFPVMAPVPLGKKACSDADIREFLDQCVFNPTPELVCAEARAVLGECASCLVADTTAELRPFYQYDKRIIAAPNNGACMYATADTDEARACAIGLGQTVVCTQASCLLPCIADSDDNYDSCVNLALNATCSEAGELVTSAPCKAHYEGPTYGFCTSGKNSDGSDMTNLEFFTALAKLYCGGGSEPIDGGADSGDAGADADAGP